MPETFYKKRVSDISWTNEQRYKVIQKFLERADDALQGPIYEQQDVSDPNAGVKEHLIFYKDGSVKLNNPVYSKDVYDLAIHRLRPFILFSEPIHIQKITRHVKFLLKKEINCQIDRFVDYGDQFFTDKNEFKPVHFYTYIGENNDKNNDIKANSAELALYYIYGRSVKTDIDKDEFLLDFEDPNIAVVTDALNAYIIQLYIVIHCLKKQIEIFIDCNSFDI